MSGPAAKRARTDGASVSSRVSCHAALANPKLVIEEFPATETCVSTVAAARKACADCVSGADDRVMVIVGPCSIHDPQSAMEYAKRLKVEAEKYKNELVIIMRVYFEKPRTTVGWKGLINDPYMDNSYKMNDGLRMGRKLLRDINDMGLPCGCELLDMISPQYIEDLVSWAAIGVRTTECQTHRELASSVGMPVGFKNGTSGDVGVAIDAIQSAGSPHHFFGVTEHGAAALVHSEGNNTAHVVLRGGKVGPNYEEKHVKEAYAALEKKGLKRGIVVDCSHGNSNKNHKNQPKVSADLCEQIKKGNPIAGVMIESHLFEGNQSLPKDEELAKLRQASYTLGESPVLKAGVLKYGVSITDACVDWPTTVEMLGPLAEAVRASRAAKK